MKTDNERKEITKGLLETIGTVQKSKQLNEVTADLKMALKTIVPTAAASKGVWDIPDHNRVTLDTGFWHYSLTKINVPHNPMTSAASRYEYSLFCSVIISNRNLSHGDPGAVSQNGLTKSWNADNPQKLKKMLTDWKKNLCQMIENG